MLDPFAGVGGTLLGAAIARGPRRAIVELDPRWVAVYEEVVGALAAERDGAGPADRRAGDRRPRPAPSVRSEGSRWTGDALKLLPTLADESVDLVATDPPYNIQLPLTMAGGTTLAETHSNRRTDYAMVSDADPTWPTRPTIRRLPRRDRADVLGADARTEVGPLRDRHRARCVSERPVPVRQGRPRGTRGERRPRPEGDLIWHQAGTRLRPYGYPGSSSNIAHQHILVLRREPAASAHARRRLSR